MMLLAVEKRNVLVVEANYFHPLVIGNPDDCTKSLVYSEAKRSRFNSLCDLLRLNRKPRFKTCPHLL